MTRQYVISTPLGPVFVSETGSRTANIAGVFLTETVVTVQVLAPSSDISAGGWLPSSGVSLYPMLDESPYNDTDYIISGPSPAADTARIKLSGLTPIDSTGHVLTYRLDTGGCSSVTVNLYSGATLIKTWTHTGVPPGVTQYTQTLTSLEAATIGDYSDLEVEFIANA